MKTTGLTRYILLLSLLLSSGLGTSLSYAATPGDREYQIKLAFLTNFISYTQWPNHTEKLNQFYFCTSSDRFKELATPHIQSKNSAQRNFVLLKVKPGEELQCDLLFVLTEDTDIWQPYLAESKPGSILLVGERRGFASSAGIINFFLAGNKVRFEINLDHLESSGLKISSRLLRLAKLIRSGENSDD